MDLETDSKMNEKEILEKIELYEGKIEQAKRDELHEEIPYLMLTIRSLNKLLDNLYDSRINKKD